jgi:putative ABC transport system permease protein
MFEIEKAINEWKRKLRTVESLEDGTIREIESHLREEIDRQTAKGLAPEDAFDRAVALVGEVESIGDEYHKTNARRLAPPPSWRPAKFSAGLLWNYYKTAVRKARRQKAHFAINIAGLAIGMTCCLLLGLWIRDELSYDRFHRNAGRIYRVQAFEIRDQREFRLASTPAPLAPALQADFPGIDATVRIGATGFNVVSGTARFLEEVFFADPEIFEVFDVPLLRGDSKTALLDPGAILISESMSRKYFAEDDPVGRTLTLKDWADFRIAGVFKDLPPQSHFHPGFLASFAKFARRHFEQWGISNYYTYILTGPGFDPQSFDAGKDRFVRTHNGNAVSSGSGLRYVLQPLTRIHLYSDANNEIEANGDIGRLMIFSGLALFILLIACFNYVNFATASSAIRTKEIGLRKVVGAVRGQVAFQFLGETLLICLAAMAAAVVLASLLLPVFNALSEKSLRFADLWNGPLLAGVFLFMILTGLLAGSYPAAILSAVRPMSALRSIGGLNLKAPKFRNVLVVLQFAASIGFILATFVIASQMTYIRDKKLGFDKEHVISLPLRDENLLKKVDVLKTELRATPDLIHVSASSFRPGTSIFRQNYWKEGMGPNEFPAISWLAADPEFLNTMGLELAEGRNFDPKIPSDLGRAYLLNETAVREIGLPSPIGKRFKIVEDGTVIGVVKDFHFDSLHKKIEPLALCVFPPEYQYLSVRVRPGRTAEALAALKKAWAKVVPGTAFEYSFLDEDINRLYRADLRLNRIFLASAAAAVLVACLGLFGLASLGARRRIKEIGIRKVLGASTARLASGLCAEYLGLVLAANALAWPAAYGAMKSWLGNFAYAVPLNFWLFPGAAALAAAIALFTVGFLAVKAARTDPCECLREE